MGLTRLLKPTAKQQMVDDGTATWSRAREGNDRVSPTALRFSSCPRMSTTQQSLDEFASRRDVIPSRVFERYIWTNPEVCSECFARIRTEHTLTRDQWGNTVTELDRAGSGIQGYDNVNGGGVYLPRTFCEECGGRGHADPDTDSKVQATQRAGRIVTRLEEQDIPVAARAVRRAARKLKAKPELEALDREIYERATKLGVERGQR